VTRLGFIGVGNMGAPMARRLIEAGYEMVVYDIQSEKAASLGVPTASSPQDVADAAEILLLSLPMPDIVRDVIASIAPGSRVKIVIDLSTTGRDTIIELADLLDSRGIALVDAPVSGGVSGATKGTLAVMVAGPPEAVAQVRPILDVIGKVFLVGDSAGQGQVMKVVNNLLSATALAATSEAMIVGVKAGLDPAIMLDVLNASSGRNTATSEKFPRSVLDRSFNFGFRAALLAKDVKLCRALAESMNMPFSIGAAVDDVWARAAARLGDGDFTRIIEFLEEGTGVVVGGG
jgi:3-hydroxyisobutyrate dehydrogenase-like beta-hydroxyacid dehydrogenase